MKIISVTKLNRFAKQVLESEIGQVWVSGEISNFTRAASGHWYFTLKDQGAQVRTAMFKGANQSVSFMPKQGDKVIVRANISLYEARGDYQLIAIKMEPEGVGQLKQAFEALKLQLQDEGLFSQDNKQTLPKVVKKIGLVTSATGAAVHDILHVLQRRNPAVEVILYPSMVQGEGAALTIVSQIEKANQRNEVDVLVVGRGGGSLEDLWPFNEEIVARAIFASALPTVSAVGHEVDVTIADFVADLRAATPSAAAELLSEDKQNLQHSINQLKRRLMNSLLQQLDSKRSVANSSASRLQAQHPQKLVQKQAQSFDYLYSRFLQQHPNKSIKKQHQNLDYLIQRLNAQQPNTRIKQTHSKLNELTQRLHQSMNNKLIADKREQSLLNQKMAQTSPLAHIQTAQKHIDAQLNNLEKLTSQQITLKRHALASVSDVLNTVSPLATLARGYSITMQNDTVVKSTDAIKIGDNILSKLVDGDVNSKVLSVSKKG
ncbi:exodeoxyribonuclease VII large subunit [Aestuariibacter sp. P117]|uniref:Exodeoxyribonuclease 7 large subunit n=2 Tax=Glaciecola petra TaxID=3075602 RepID=A0ABU2ZT86_9ALTE|nr:exodeoxyribonuclease VII large subunit [Aestuariibacter sp. P117]MDT0595860.1 exodeoxyribonuclease VII large subunit [Aestuariibacter sp. P117]